MVKNKVRPSFFLFLFLSCHVYYVAGQNYYETEGRQKVQIFEDGSYRIADKNGTDFFTLSALHTLPPSEKAEAQVNIIEAEYFVSIHSMQKEIDVLETALKRVKQESNKALIDDYKHKIKQVKERLKDVSGLYDNALYFQKLARKSVQSPENVNAKNWQKLQEYIDGKDYIFKTTKYVQGDVQIWKNELPEKQDGVPDPISNPVTDTVIAILPEKQLISGGDCRLIHENTGTTESYAHSFEPVFSFTPQRLKVHLKEENLMECNAQVSSVGKDIFLTLRIVMRSKDAAKSYGHIQEGSIVRLEFVNGIRLNVKAPQSVFGSFEEYSGKVIYQIKCKLDKEMVKQLQNLPLDYLGIMWTSGYEKYEIFEVDVLMRQLVCIKSLKNL